MAAIWQSNWLIGIPVIVEITSCNASHEARFRLSEASVKSPCKHIIWDWNGTLLNDTWLCVEVLNCLLAKRGREQLTQDEYRQNFGFPVIHFYECLGFETDVASYDRISREFIDHYESRWFGECELHPEAADVLTTFRQRGISHSVLSAAKQEAVESGVLYYGIHEHFMGLIGTDNIHAHGKVAQGRRWMAELQLPPEEVVLVGDTLHDFEVAQDIGSRCVLIAHGHHTPERLAETGALIVHSLRELLDCL